MDNNKTSTRWWLWWAAFPYGLVSCLRAALYRQGWFASRRLPCRVVSVGNLTMGGTGKTPVVIYLAEWLLSQGKCVGVLSRGYGRQSRASPLLVSDGQRLLADPAEAGDEPYLIAKRCPRAIVAVGADRYELGRWVLERFPIDCFLLDDGFQHLALHRDVNLLLIDATDCAGLAAMFPVGRLREPLTAAARASAVLLTRVDQAGASNGVLTQLHQVSPALREPIQVSFRPEGFVHAMTSQLIGVDHVLAKTAVAFSGIGNARSFRTLLAGMGLNVLDEIVFPDHHTYTASDLDQVRQRAAQVGAELLVTTEKDLGKIVPFLVPADQCWALRLRTDIFDGRERLERLLFPGDGRQVTSEKVQNPKFEVRC